MSSHKGFFKGEKKKSKKKQKEKSNSISNSPTYNMPEIITKNKSSEE